MLVVTLSKSLPVQNKHLKCKTESYEIIEQKLGKNAGG